MRTPRALLACALALAFAVAAVDVAPARAEAWLPTMPTTEELTPRQKRAVKRSYRAANAAFARRRWKRALSHADKTFELLPNASTALIRATVLEKLERAQEAFLAYLLAADLGPSGDERALIEAGLGRLGRDLDVGWLDVSARPEGATIFVDGLAFSGHRSVGLPRGEHEVVVDLEGFVTHREEVAIAAGGKTPVNITLRRVTPPAVDPLDDKSSVAVVEPTPTPPVEPSDTGWWVIGGGSAVLIAGLVTHVAAVGASDEADGWSAPRDGVSSAARRVRYGEAVARKDDLELATWLCYGLGGAAVATGVVLILLDTPPEPGAAHVTPVAIGGGGGLQLDVQF